MRTNTSPTKQTEMKHKDRQGPSRPAQSVECYLMLFVTGGVETVRAGRRPGTARNPPEVNQARPPTVRKAGQSMTTVTTVFQ